MLIFSLFQIFSYLLRDRVLPCLACTEDENCTRAAIMGDLGDHEAEQLFPCEAEQQQ